MPSLCNFEASVIANTGIPPSTRLPEYDVQSSVQQLLLAPPTNAPNGSTTDKKTMTSTSQCYIPCTPNQTFRVMVSNSSNEDACIMLFVDGEWIYSGLSYGPTHKTIYFSGRLIDEITIQEMKFVDLDTTYDGNGVKPKEGLGTIIVRIYRVKVTGPWQGKLTPASVAESKPIMVGEKHGPVNLEHRVVFSPPTQMKTAVKPQSTEWIDSKGGPPFAEFIFHYRSKERLREMGILPAKSLLEEKAERSEFSDAKESGSQRKSFWTFWSK